MSLNTVPAISEARVPRGMVLINDEILYFDSIEVTNNNNYQADTFRIPLTISQQPPAFNAKYWAESTPMLVNIYIGFPPNPERYTKDDLDKVLMGEVDGVDYDPVAGTVTLTGRNLVSRFIDNKTTEGFSNMTFSQIAEMLATRRGLKAQVTKTSVKVGIFYSQNHVDLNNQHTEWDLLSFLADQEGFILYVKNDTLYSHPKPQPDENPYIIQWQWPDQERAYSRGNVVSITLSRNLTLAKDVIVKIRTVNPKTGKTVEKIAKATHNKKNKYDPGVQVYTEFLPGLTPEQALQLAQKKLRAYTAWEKTFSATLPGDNKLGIENIVKVQGMNSAFDQVYYVDSITRTLEPSQGYNMTIHCKNHATESKVFI